MNSNPDSIVVFDGANIVHRCRSAWFASTGGAAQLDGWPIVYMFLRTMRSLVSELGTDGKFVYALDTFSSHRVDFYPSYKLKRRTKKLDEHQAMITAETESPEFAAACRWEVEQFLRCKILVDEVLPMIPLSAAGCEADDICAAVAVSFPDKQVVIVSGDSDMKQLLKLPNVRVYDIGKKPHAFLKDLDPDEPCDQDPARWKAIIGDSTDEIPGITGPKTARKLLLDEAAFEQALDTKVCRTQLDAGKKWREVYDRNRKLVTLVGDDRLFPLPEPQLVRDAVLGYPVSFEEEVYATAALEMNFESWYTASGPTDQWAKQVETWKQVAFQRRKPVSPVNR